MVMSVDYGLIGKRVRARRKRLGWTQEQLAERMAVSVGYVSQIERGATRANLDTLSDVAALLGCDVAELLSGATCNQRDYLTGELLQLYEGMSDGKRRLLLRLAEEILQFHEDE